VCISCKTVNQRDYNVLDVYRRLKLCTSLKKRMERSQVKFIGKDLNNTFHKVFLCNGVPAADNLLKQTRKYTLNTVIKDLALEPLKGHNSTFFLIALYIPSYISQCQ